MSALGQKQTMCSAKGHVRFTPNRRTNAVRGWFVCFVPIADIWASEDKTGRETQRGTSGPRQNDLELSKLHRQIGSQKEFYHEFRCDRCHAFA